MVIQGARFLGLLEYLRLPLLLPLLLLLLFAPDLGDKGGGSTALADTVGGSETVVVGIVGGDSDDGA